MLRMTKQADYGIVLLLSMAHQGDGQLYNARDLAFATGLPLPMVSKILKALVRGGVLASHRGINGGYGLAHSAAQTTVGQIIEALEGPIALTECVSSEPSACSVEQLCPVRLSWQKINQAVKSALEDITLQEMMDSWEDQRIKPRPASSLTQS